MKFLAHAPIVLNVVALKNYNFYILLFQKQFRRNPGENQRHLRFVTSKILGIYKVLDASSNDDTRFGGGSDQNFVKSKQEGDQPM